MRILLLKVNDIGVHRPEDIQETQYFHILLFRVDS